MSVLIVEDEILLARRMQRLVAEMLPLAETSYTHSIAETVQWLREHAKPDFILMDIELADGKSFEIFEQVAVKSPVIFTTAYDEYALKAFKVNSIDYLLKPVRKEDLEKALIKINTLRGTNEAEKIYKLIEEAKRTGESKFRERILVKQGQKLISVNVADAGLFFTQTTVAFLLTKSKQKYVLDYTLDQLEQSLDPKIFFRANRQYIISHDIIKAIHLWFNGKLKVDISLESGEPIIISRDKAPLFKEWLGE